ncbi:MAG: MscL family protein [Candidatus Saccharimonadales bacterium]
MATKKPVKKSAASAAASAAEAKRAAASAKLAAAKVKVAQGHAGGFMTFIREQGVVGLAVGLAIGTAAGASVKVIVDQLIAPIVALMTRGIDLNSLKWIIIGASGDQKEVAIGYGMIVSSLITLLATALVVYLIIHWMKLDRLDKKKD